MEEIDVKKLDVSPLNMRKKTGLVDVTPLADSIESDGLIHPIVVRPKKKGSGFEVVVGQRRFLASKQIGNKKVLARVLNVDDLTALRLSIKENRDSVKPDPIELAEAYAKYKDLCKKQKPNISLKEIAQSLGVSERDFWDTTSILEISASAKVAARTSALSKSHLLKVSPTIKEFPTKTQKKVIEVVADKDLTEKDTRRYMNGLRTYPKDDPDEVYKKVFTKQSGYELKVYFSAKVSRGLDKASDDREASREDIVQVAVEEWLKGEEYL